MRCHPDGIPGLPPGRICVQCSVPRPGLGLRHNILPAWNLQVGKAAAPLGGIAAAQLGGIAAAALGVDRTNPVQKIQASAGSTVQRFDGWAAISPSMAPPIKRWLGRDHRGGAKVWPAPQAAHDLWQARQARKANKAVSGVAALKLEPACNLCRGWHKNS